MSQNPNGLAPRPALSMQDFMRLLPAELQGASQQQQMEYLRQIAVNGTRQRAQQGQQNISSPQMNNSNEAANSSPQTFNAQLQNQSSPMQQQMGGPNQVNPAIIAIMRQAQQTGALGQPGNVQGQIGPNGAPQLTAAQIQAFLARNQQQQQQQQQQHQQQQQQQQHHHQQQQPQLPHQQQPQQHPQVSPAPNVLPLQGQAPPVPQAIGNNIRPMTPQNMPMGLPQGSPMQRAQQAREAMMKLPRPTAAPMMLPGPPGPPPPQMMMPQQAPPQPQPRPNIDQDMLRNILGNLQLFIQKKNNNELNDRQLAMLNLVLARSPELLKNMAAQKAAQQQPNVHSGAQHAVLRQLQTMTQSSVAQQQANTSVLTNQQRSMVNGMGGPPTPGNTPSRLPNGLVDQKASLETAYRKIEEMLDEKRAEVFTKNPAIRKSYLKHLQSLPDDKRAAVFTKVPALQLMYDAFCREINQQNIRMVNGPGNVATPANMPPTQIQRSPAQESSATATPITSALPPSPAVHPIPQMNHPLPNLQIPANRQKNMPPPASMQPRPIPSQTNALTQQQVLAVQAQAANQLQQIQQQQQVPQSGSPVSGQGTPIPRAASTMPIRGGTPGTGRIGALQQSSGPGQRGSQSPQNGSPIPVGAAAEAQYANRLQNTAGHAQQQLQNQANGLMQARSGFPPPRNASIHSLPPDNSFVPVSISSLIIPDNPPEALLRPQPFPNAIGPRVTLSTGLGSGTILGTPVLGTRPAVFDEILAKLGEPISKKRAARGSSLFESPGAKDEEDKDKDTAPVVNTMVVLPPKIEEQVDEEEVHGHETKKRKISDVAKGVNLNLSITDAVEDFLLEVADEFLESVVETSCKIAKHRGSTKLQVKDIQLHIEQGYEVHIPGYEADSIHIERLKTELKAAAAPPSAAPTRAARLAAVNNAKLGLPAGKVTVK